MARSWAVRPELRTEPEVRNLRTACLRLMVRSPCRSSDWTYVCRETAGMKIAWHFSRALHLDRTIETLMKDFLDRLAGASSGIGDATLNFGA